MVTIKKPIKEASSNPEEQNQQNQPEMDLEQENKQLKILLAKENLRDEVNFRAELLTMLNQLLQSLDLLSERLRDSNKIQAIANKIQIEE